jgi:1-acyl-sn-glycerol-3-phosphate acyltransferase
MTAVPAPPSAPAQSATRRPGVKDRVFTFYIYVTLWIAVIIFVLLFGPFLLLADYTFDRRRALARKIARAVFRRLVDHFCRLRGDRLVVDPAPFDWHTLGPCIVIANHGSAMDSVLLMALPPGVGDGRIWSKGWPFRVPLLGWLMRLSGHLFVEDFNILPDAQSCLGDGTSLLVFPESSRTRTGKLGRFRDGAFLLAARTGRPIVVAAIHGAHACFPPGQPWIFGPPLRVEPLGILLPIRGNPKDHMRLKREAHRMISEALSQRDRPVLSAKASSAA